MIPKRSLLVFLICCLLIGCNREPESQTKNTTPAAPKKSSVALTVLVSGDPKLAEGLNLLRGEWAERNGGEMNVVEATTESLLGNDSLDADIVVFASRQLGGLVAKEQLRPIRTSLLKSESFQESDLLPVIQNRFLRYGEKTYALSFGEAPLVLLSKNAESPSNWQALTEGQSGLRVSPRIQFPGAVELLARAMGYASSGGRSAILFDPQNMGPRIDSAPFQRALQELIATRGATDDSAKSTQWMLTYPQAISEDTDSNERIHCHPLPPVKESFNYLREVWEPAESASPKALLGFSGRSIGVTRSSRNASSAFKLLEWLTTGEIAMKLSQRSDATLWCRGSHTAEAFQWFEKVPLEQDSLNVISDLLKSEDVYLLPRIPAIDEYLAAWEKTIQESIAGEKTVEEALQAATQSWEEITERNGRERQQAAYRMHLGL